MTVVREYPWTRLTLRFWLNGLLGALTIALSLPGPVMPENGLDPSWRLGLSWANQLGLQWGPEIDFTYGPLGYAIGPVPLDLGILVSGVALQVVWLALGVTALRVSTGRLGFGWSWIVTFGVIHLITAVDMSILQLLVVLLIGLWLLTSSAPLRTRILVSVLLGLLASMALLTKFSTGSVAVGLALVAAVAAGPWLRGLLACAGGLVLGLLVPWLVLGQSLSNLGLWLVRSLQSAAGYGSAMGISNLRFSSVILALLVAWVVAIIVAAWLLSSDQTRLRRAAITLIVAAATIGVLVSGTTRFDLGHVLLTLVFLAAATIGVLCGLSSTVPVVSASRVLSLSFIGLSLIGALAINQLNPQSRPSEPLHFGRSAVGAAKAAVWTVDADARTQSLKAAAKDMRRESATPNRVSVPLRGRGVQGDPWDVGRVWALGLNWRPVPTFQTYAAYTAALDEANANALVGPNGPTGILRTTLANGMPRTIDGRNGLWDSPEYQLAVLCNFELAGRSPQVESLIRSADVCAQPRPMTALSVVAGEAVALPAAPGRILVANVTADASAPFWDPLLPGRYPLRVSCGASSYRVAAGSPSGPLIVAIPAVVSGWHSPSQPQSCGTITINANATVAFSEIAVATP